MLYLNRKQGETIVINNEIFITVTEIKGNYVKIGCQFPSHATVLRKEIHDKISTENIAASNFDVNIVEELIKGDKIDNNKGS